MNTKRMYKHICPISRVAKLLSDSWTMLIIHHLLNNKTMRFCELERTLSGISTRTLTIKLKTLEDQGILKKTEEGYSSTPTGKKLRGVLREMERFGEKIMIN